MTETTVQVSQRHSLAQAAERSPMRWGRTISRLLRNYPHLAIGGIVTLTFVVVALLAPVLAPYSYADQRLADRLLPPIWAGGNTSHLLGTDEFGRDTLTRLLFGARVSLIVGLFSVLIAGIIGVAIGLVSGYSGGNVDAFIMRVADVLLAFPYIRIAIIVSAFWGGGLATTVIALSLAGWIGFARVSRGLVLGIKQADYVLAARSIGAAELRIVLRHVLPNMLNPLLVYMTFQIPARILAEATLSFLGLGVQPPAPSWGNMLAQNRTFLLSQPWLVILPGLAISITALGTNLFGDGLRDLLDPRMRRRA